MQASRFVSTLALAVAAVSGYAAYRRGQQRGSNASNHHSGSEPLQRWEGEGGGVPVSEHRTAAQVRSDDDSQTLDAALPQPQTSQLGR